MNCWICGRPADSREHLIKASDLRFFFGRVSPSRPLYLHSERISNIPLHSAKSNKLKTSKIICRRCNDTKTARYDNSWTQLLSALYGNWSRVKTTRRFKLQKAFPGASRNAVLNCHLYFVKFGCRIVDERTPIDIRQFAESVRLGVPHPTVFLTFNTRTLAPPRMQYAGPSAVEAQERNGICEVASWYYTLGELDVQVT